MKAQYFSFQNCTNISNDICFEILPWYITSVHIVNGNTKQAAVSQSMMINDNIEHNMAFGQPSGSQQSRDCVTCVHRLWRARIYYLA